MNYRESVYIPGDFNDSMNKFFFGQWLISLQTLRAVGNIKMPCTVSPTVITTKPITTERNLIIKWCCGLLPTVTNVIKKEDNTANTMSHVNVCYVLPS